MGTVDVDVRPEQVLLRALVKKGVNSEIAAHAAEYLTTDEAALYLALVDELSAAHLKAFLIERFPEKAQEVFADDLVSKRPLEVVATNSHHRRTGDH